MRNKSFPILVIMLSLGALLLAACGGETASAEVNSPYSIQQVDGTDLNRIILTERAAERLGIETVTVESGNTEAIPYASILYDVNGNTWVYVAVEPLTYIREAVSVDRIDEDQAILSEGLEPGTEVVTIGVAELFGADSGVGK